MRFSMTAGPCPGQRILNLVVPGTGCPARPGAQLHPRPAAPAPTPAPAPAPARTTAPASDGDDTGGDGSVSYANCAAVRAAGAAPIRRGDPGYGRHLDRDGDGIACERQSLSDRWCRVSWRSRLRGAGGSRAGPYGRVVPPGTGVAWW
ncbi:excalibur calcium-binding domain-containing protein [Streptomyces sp. NRRL F-2664]|uniref:excalibur calcium-binding domain-containing protein n=1 Tax=Streptomyces sp. NRRL F-2664 TaxID=1463842 RepID=UPI003B639E86